MNNENEIIEQKEESLEELLERVNDERVPGEQFNAFTIKSTIGKDDYRYFLYHSVLFKKKWMLPVYLILPPVLSFSFSLVDGGLNVVNFLVMTVIFYVLMFGVIAFRTERTMSKINKKSPQTLRLTDTTFSFTGKGIIHSKNGESLNVSYKTLVLVSPGKNRTVLYFSSRKAMVIRNEDIEKVMPVDDFVKLMNSKISK